MGLCVETFHAPPKMAYNPPLKFGNMDELSIPHDATNGKSGECFPSANLKALLEHLSEEIMVKCFKDLSELTTFLLVFRCVLITLRSTACLLVVWENRVVCNDGMFNGVTHRLCPFKGNAMFTINFEGAKLWTTNKDVTRKEVTRASCSSRRRQFNV